MRARVNSRPQKKRGMSQTQRLWCTKNKVWRLWVPFFSFSVSYSIFESLNSCILIFFLFVSSPQKHFSFRERQPLFARDSNLLLLLLLFLRVLPKTTPDEKDENAALLFFYDDDDDDAKNNSHRHVDGDAQTRKKTEENRPRRG